jgi:3-dehydroquinate synthase
MDSRMNILSENLVNISNHTYKVILSKNFLGLSKEISLINNISSIHIITEKRINELYGKELSEELSILNIPFKFIIIKGKESNKHISKVRNVYNSLIKNGADRKSVVLALGGGVVGDFSGFIAASFLRGIRFVQVPTTLLACVDSSVGGKVAVNADLGKNMIGAFHQPELVFAPIHTLINTLPDKEWKCGLSEVLKHSLLEGGTFFEFMKNINRKDLKNPETISTFIRESVSFKSKIVSLDPKENGIRAVLNLGHTTGHAIESLLNYKKLSHGEAVGIGLITALHLSINKFNLDRITLSDTIKIMKNLKLPFKINLENKQLIHHMKHDKKNYNGKIFFILLENLGNPKYGIEVTEEEIYQALENQKNI